MYHVCDYVICVLLHAGFYLQPVDNEVLAQSLAAAAWLRMLELMHDMQQKHMHGMLEGELPKDSELAEEGLHQVC